MISKKNKKKDNGINVMLSLSHLEQWTWANSSYKLPELQTVPTISNKFSSNYFLGYDLNPVGFTHAQFFYFSFDLAFYLLDMNLMAFNKYTILYSFDGITKVFQDQRILILNMPGL